MKLVKQIKSQPLASLLNKYIPSEVRVTKQSSNCTFLTQKPSSDEELTPLPDAILFIQSQNTAVVKSELVFNKWTPPPAGAERHGGELNTGF